MKLWDGRFTKATDAATDHFNSSIQIDARMYRQDIQGSIAHAKMLAKQGIISETDSARIQNTLLDIGADIEAGRVTLSIEAEDIHMNIEKLLIERLGDVGKRLHTGRSRNDQVTLDMRLYLRSESYTLIELLDELNSMLTTLAKSYLGVIMPGYTHLQKAQPVLFSHHLLAYREMYSRDRERLSQCIDRMNVSPLGSGALAGTTYPLDREYVARELHMHGVTQNSLDAVSDRDYVIELCFVLSMIMMHTSRFAEEIILWSSSEFSFIELDDAFATGSSIMPQKKNPDIAELARGKTGRVYGDLIALLTVMKGLPLAYNKDMQEDKEQVFDAVDTVKMMLPVFTRMLATMQINADVMQHGAESGFTNATDAADYLVKKGMPFRDAHKVVGKMVAYCIQNQKPISDLTMEEFLSFSDLFDADVYDAISLKTCVNARDITGGTAVQQVKKQL